MEHTSSELTRPDDIVGGFASEAQRRPNPRSVGAYSSIQTHFLARLQGLEEARRQLDALPAQDPFMRKLVGRGLFATYLECIDVGVGCEARQILYMPTAR